MTDAQQREAARQIFYEWNGKGKEKVNQIDRFTLILGDGC